MSQIEKIQEAKNELFKLLLAHTDNTDSWAMVQMDTIDSAIDLILDVKRTPESTVLHMIRTEKLKTEVQRELNYTYDVLHTKVDSLPPSMKLEKEEDLHRYDVASSSLMHALELVERLFANILADKL